MRGSSAGATGPPCSSTPAPPWLSTTRPARRCTPRWPPAWRVPPRRSTRVRRRRRSTAGWPQRRCERLRCDALGIVEVEHEAATVRPEADPVVVGGDDVRRRHHSPVAAAPEQLAAPPDELARGEVAVPRRDVVQAHPCDVAVPLDDHHAHRLVTLRY